MQSKYPLTVNLGEVNLPAGINMEELRMKLKSIIGNMVVIALGLSSVAYASDYYPPERMDCRFTDKGKISCEAFDRSYLTEDLSNAEFPHDVNEVFYFVSAAAYFSPSQHEASVFYTYHNQDGQMVKLRTVNSDIRPNLRKGNWRKLNRDIYVCNAGYMSCPITS